MQEQEQPIVELSTIFKRRTFSLDGERFDVKSIEEFSLKIQADILRHHRTMARLINRDEPLTDVENYEIEFAMREVFLAFVVDGGRVVDKLTSGQQIRVVNVALSQRNSDKG